MTPTEGRWVAEEAPKQPGMMHINCYHDRPGEEDGLWLADVSNFNEADPLVMAAAPDLLKALKEMVGIVPPIGVDGIESPICGYCGADAHSSDLPGGYRIEHRQPCEWVNARAAIAKAEGRQP